MCRKRQSHGSPSHLTLSYLLISPPPCLLSQVSRTFYVRPSLFPLHPSSHLLSPTFLPPLPFIPHSSPSSAISPQRTSPYTPSRPCAQSFITARPNQLSHTPSFKKRHPTCRALPSSHVSSPHFSRPINIASFPSRPKSFAIGVLEDILKAFEGLGEEAAGSPERVD